MDKGVAEARTALAAASDADMMKDWSLLAGGHKIFTMPKIAVHPQHGASTTSFITARNSRSIYRLLGIPVPGLYGPSADETEASAAAAQ